MMERRTTPRLCAMQRGRPSRQWVGAASLGALRDMLPAMRIPRLAIVGLAISASVVGQWTQAAPGALPGRLACAASATDATGNVLMFGGKTFPSSGFVTNRTWTFDGTNWTLRAPAASPPATWGARLACDTARNVVVMYGGYQIAETYPPQDQTWEWNGTTWTRVFPAHTPGGLGWHGMSFDSWRNRIVVFGGIRQSQIDTGETWEYDGIDWTRILPAISPAPRRSHAMCFHAGIGMTVLFSGINAQTGSDDVTWAYNGVDWVPLALPAPRPAARVGAGLVYDSVRGVCVLTAGTTQSPLALANDTWEFDGTAWASMPTSIVAHDCAAVAFHTSKRLMVLHGGMSGSIAFEDDTWTYGARSGTFGSGCMGTNGVPSLTSLDAPRLGQSYTVVLTNLEPSINLAILMFGFQPSSGTSLAAYGMPTCSLFTAPEVLIGVAGAAGSATWVWPTVGGAMGIPLYGQALAFDPAANAAGLTVSNAISALIGH